MYFLIDFEECCKNASVFMVIKCRTQNNRLKGCLSEWYNNQQFREYVTQLYIDERAEYRRTGVQKKFKRM
jgi:COX assembly protein 1